MTNGDRIRKMNDAELTLAIYQAQTYCEEFCANETCTATSKECKEGIYKWLKKEENK